MIGYDHEGYYARNRETGEEKFLSYDFETAAMLIHKYSHGWGLVNMWGQVVG